MAPSLVKIAREQHTSVHGLRQHSCDEVVSIHKHGVPQELLVAHSTEPTYVIRTDTSRHTDGHSHYEQDCTCTACCSAPGHGAAVHWSGVVSMHLSHAVPCPMHMTCLTAHGQVATARGR